MNKTYLVSFWKVYTDGRESEKCFDTLRANSLAEIKAIFAATPPSEYYCDEIRRPRFWTEAKE